MNILVLNAGSSSLKYQLFDMRDNGILAKGQCERIGMAGGKIKHTASNPTRVHEAAADMSDHAQAITAVLALFTHKDLGVLTSMEEIDAVGHRVVHGGEAFAHSTLINDRVLAAIEDCCALAPLHNPPNLTGIRACMQLMPGVPQVAVFDTAFHQTIPEHAYLYALPCEYYTEDKIRRYGFHGTSHRYVSERAAAFLGRSADELKIITCHLGNGSSVAAVKHGRSVDTSMGLTPLEGVPMGTRSGSIDPAIIQFLMESKNFTISETMDILNKKSGMLGISGVSSDFRDLDQAASNGNDRAALAVKMFCYAVKKMIGALAAAMGGVDVLVFTAGVGENNPPVRAAICDGLEFLGLHLDAAKNAQARGVEIDVSAAGSPHRVVIIPTNEELVIARDTETIVTNN